MIYFPLDRDGPEERKDIMQELKLYLETSVWNFFFADDAPEKRDITKRFFESIKENIYEIFISEVVIREINDAPEPKRRVLFDLVNKYAPVGKIMLLL